MLGIIITFVLFGFITKGMQNNNLLRSLGYDTFTMLKYSFIDYPAKTVQNFMQDFSSLWSVKEENDKLKQELAKQEQYGDLYRESKRQLEELKKLHKITESNTSYRFIEGEVVMRDHETWSSTITINKGSRDNVKENMAVITSEGLIGKVMSVNGSTSKVKLLSANDNYTNVSVRIELDKDKTTEAFLMGFDAKKNCFIVQLYNVNENVKKGMRVITSGAGGVYPSGLSVGKISSVEIPDNKFGKVIYVKPAADFNDFDYVAVVDATGGK